ncbi:hypothetical protein [Ensifer sp. 4252]|uniref:hypothetical protein n=1 Tax=Ensifer sp. 4252 TaxID=3373915 RepID=UPI003D2409AD
MKIKNVGVTIQSGAVFVPVADTERAKAWYARPFGLSTVPESQHGRQPESQHGYLAVFLAAGTVAWFSMRRSGTG